MTGARLNRRLALLLVAAAFFSFAIIACGGDDDNDDAAELESTATEQPDGGQVATAIDATPTALGGDEPTASEEAPTESEPAGGDADGIPLSALVIPPARDEAIPQNGRVLGNPDAAVSIVEYGDFQ